MAQSADAALSKNSSDMGALIGSAYGAEAAAEFQDMWFRHVTFLFDYARGVSDEDVDVQADARNRLDAYPGELSQASSERYQKALFPSELVYYPTLQPQIRL